MTPGNRSAENRSFTQRCQHAFLPGDRQRGEDYAADLRVHILVEDAHNLIATVEGDTGDYRSGALLSDVRDGALQLACDCPRAAQGYPCKHLWALLLTADDRLSERFPGHERFGVELISADGNGRRKSPQRGSTMASSAETLAHFEQESERVSNDVLPPEVTQVPRAGEPVLGAMQPRRLEDSELSPDAPRRLPAWATFVRRARQYEHQRASSVRSASALNSASEFWYLLDLQEINITGRLWIHLFQSTGTSEQTVAPLKRQSLLNVDLESVQSTADRLALTLLMASRTSRQVSGPGRVPSAEADRTRIPATLTHEILTQLSATGRLAWGTSIRSLDEVPLDFELHSLVTDNQGDWHVVIRVVAVDDQSGENSSTKLHDDDVAYQVTTELRRDSEVRSSTEVLATTQDGVVVQRNVISFLGDNTASWLNAAIHTPSFALSRNDLGDFTAQLLNSTPAPQLDLPASANILCESPPPTGHVILLAPDIESSVVPAQVSFLYDTESFALDDARQYAWSPKDQRVISRRLDLEQELLRQLRDILASPVQRYGHDPESICLPIEGLASAVVRLVEAGWEVMADGRRVRPASSFNIQVESGTDWFDVEASLEFEDANVPMPRLLRALRNRDRFVILDDGSQGILPEEWLNRFARLSDFGKPADAAKSTRLRFQPNQALLLDAILENSDYVSRDHGFVNRCRKLKAFDRIPSARTPRNFRGELRPYQLDGLAWLKFLPTLQLNGCLADDMGLGKTIQVLAMLESRRTRRLAAGETRLPALAVVPKSLVFNWIEEAERFTPKLRVGNYTGTDRQATLERLEDFDLLVTTYATMRRDVAQLCQYPFDGIVLDEATAIKNNDSQTAKAARMLRGKYRIAMTGTPVENHLGELWSIFEFLNPGLLGSSATFREVTSRRQHEEADLLWLRQAIRPFILRRTKEQVLTDLPEKTEQTLYCELGSKQRKLYDELRDYYRAILQKKVETRGLGKTKFHALEGLLRLRQAACDPRLLDEQQATGSKLELLYARLEEVLERGHKALVFSQFTSLLRLAQDEMLNRHWHIAYLDGKTRDRQACVDRFQTDPSCQIFLISLKAGGHGLNLTAADYVFILDPWWNPAVEAQAVDRAHRIGQTQRVLAYRMIARDTVEEKVVALQESKSELADAIISADNRLVSQMTPDDLQFLFA